jgi:hypothetical protein
MIDQCGSQPRNPLAILVSDQTNKPTGILFGDKATVDVLEFIEKTEEGKRLAVESDKADSWNIERLDWDENEDGEAEYDEGE